MKITAGQCVLSFVKTRLANPRLLFERRSGAYDVTPDGQSFVMLDDSKAELPATQLILVQNWAEELKRLVPTDK